MRRCRAKSAEKKFKMRRCHRNFASKKIFQGETGSLHRLGADLDYNVIVEHVLVMTSWFSTPLSSFWQAVAVAALDGVGFAPSNEDFAFRAGVCHLMNLFLRTMFKLRQDPVQFLGLFFGH